MSMREALRQMPASAGRVPEVSGEAARASASDEATRPRHETESTGSALLRAAPDMNSLVAVGTLSAYLYSLVATLVWGRVVFGIEVQIASPVAFVVALAVTLASLATFGFLLSVTVVRYRTGWALGNLLEYPGWLLCGFLVPLDLFPGWVQWLAQTLPPTWGMAAIRSAAAGQTPWGEIAVCAGLGLGYAVLATILSERLVDSARRNATLALT